VPQQIAFRDELPYNETGKLLRRRVREELELELASQGSG
jgi:acyl-coenzyme A synthetase/AMP-(fatty) acid ligase